MINQELIYLLNQLEKAERVKNSDNFFYFFNTYFVNQYPPSKYHKVIADALTDVNIKKLAIVAPRESAKTTLLQRFIIWLIVKKRANFIVIIAESFERACDFLRDIKYELENNELLINDYGKMVGKEWAKHRILTKNDTMVMAFSKTSVRGAKYRNYRPDYIIIDDLENEAIVFSTALYHLKEWFKKTVMHLGDFNSRYIISGTIISKKALLYDIIHDPTWTSYVFRAVMKYAERDDLWNQWVKIVTDVKNPNRLVEGKIFFNEHKEEMLKGAETFWDGNPLYDYYELMIQRYVSPGLSAFESEKQNNPISISGSIITEDQIQYYDELPKNLSYFLGVDPSLGVNDYTAMVIVGMDDHSMPYIVDANTYLLNDPKDIANIVLELDQKYNFTAIGIESVGFQRWLNYIIRDLDPRIGTKIVEVQSSSGSSIKSQKSIKFRSMKTFILNSRFNRTLRMLIDQIIMFPNLEHDDLLDALYIASILTDKYIPIAVF